MAYRKFSLNVTELLAKAKEMGRVREWNDKEWIDLVVEDYQQPTNFGKTIGVFFDKKKEEYSKKPEELPNLRLAEGFIYYTYKEKQAMGIPTTSHQTQNTQQEQEQPASTVDDGNLPF